VAEPTPRVAKRWNSSDSDPNLSTNAFGGPGESLKWERLAGRAGRRRVAKYPTFSIASGALAREPVPRKSPSRPGRAGPGQHRSSPVRTPDGVALWQSWSGSQPGMSRVSPLSRVARMMPHLISRLPLCTDQRDDRRPRGKIGEDFAHVTPMLVQCNCSVVFRFRRQSDALTT
jgi:hypothetical protein